MAIKAQFVWFGKLLNIFMEEYVLEAEEAVSKNGVGGWVHLV